jgi:hypothetical protein
MKRHTITDWLVVLAGAVLILMSLIVQFLRSIVNFPACGTGQDVTLDIQMERFSSAGKQAQCRTNLLIPGFS